MSLSIMTIMTNDSGKEHIDADFSQRLQQKSFIDDGYFIFI